MYLSGMRGASLWRVAVTRCIFGLDRGLSCIPATRHGAGVCCRRGEEVAVRDGRPNGELLLATGTLEDDNPADCLSVQARQHMYPLAGALTRFASKGTSHEPVSIRRCVGHLFPCAREKVAIVLAVGPG